MNHNQGTPANLAEAIARALNSEAGRVFNVRFRPDSTLVQLILAGVRDRLAQDFAVARMSCGTHDTVELYICELWEKIFPPKDKESNHE